MKVTFFLFGLLLVAFVSQTLGHSYLTKPISRSNQKQTQTGCRGPNCFGPCDRSRSAATRAPIIIERGASISVEWPRNNHAGGFIRLAWAPTSESDLHTAFDSRVQQISCHEVGGCGPDNSADPNGGDSGPPDGSSRVCKVTINVPTWLGDGGWTLQWAWYGGAFALGDYYSCVDYTISGGPFTPTQSAAVFLGGDVTYPGQQKCKYFNTDRLHRCASEPCDNPVYTLYQERSGPPFGIPSSVPPTPVPVPTPVPSPSPIPPSIPSTTRKVPVPVPSPSPVPVPTPNPVPAPTGSCTLGQQRCSSTSSFQTCVYTSNTAVGWSINQPCATGTRCNSLQNYIYCA